VVRKANKAECLGNVNGRIFSCSNSRRFRKELFLFTVFLVWDNSGVRDKGEEMKRLIVVVSVVLLCNICWGHEYSGALNELLHSIELRLDRLEKGDVFHCDGKELGGNGALVVMCPTCREIWFKNMNGIWLNTENTKRKDIIMEALY